MVAEGGFRDCNRPFTRRTRGVFGLGIIPCELYAITYAVVFVNLDEGLSFSFVNGYLDLFTGSMAHWFPHKTTLLPKPSLALHIYISSSPPPYKIDSTGINPSLHFIPACSFAHPNNAS